MNSRIDFKNIDKGIAIINKNLKVISFDSSFMDLYNHADIIKIENFKIKGKNQRRIFITFKDQNIFPDWTDVKQEINIMLYDTDLDLRTKGIVVIWIGEFPIKEKADEYYTVLKDYFDNLYGNGQKVKSEPTSQYSDNYKINDNISVDLSCDDWWSKGTANRLDLRILRNEKKSSSQ